MKLVVRMLLTIVALSAWVSEAAAQTPMPRVSVGGLGGVTLVTETGALFGGGFAVHLTRHVAVVGEVGRLTSVLPKHLQTDMNTVAASLGAQFGRPLVIDVQARATYVAAGVRIQGTERRLTPFLDGRIGRARGTSYLTATVGTRDVSADVKEAIALQEGETDTIAMVGLGLAIRATSRVTFDLGYRFQRILVDDPPFNTSIVLAGISVRF